MTAPGGIIAKRGSTSCDHRIDLHR